MKLSVPYYSQFLDVADAAWRPKACGMTCVAMVLAHTGNVQGIDALIQEAVAAGGYGPSGWFHDALVHTLKEHGAPQARRAESIENIDALVASLDAGAPTIVSVVDEILEQTKFHMVVLVGYEEDESGEVSGFYYHDPQSLSPENGANRFVPIAAFLKHWRKMAIFIS